MTTRSRNARAGVPFTPEWRRSSRPNDVFSPPPNQQTDWWRKYPCLICGISPTSHSSNHRRCSRCRSVVYCSVECQRRDYGRRRRRRRRRSSGSGDGDIGDGGDGGGGGGHGANCAIIGRLWEEKSMLESRLWTLAEEAGGDPPGSGSDDGGVDRGGMGGRRRSTNPFDDDYDYDDYDDDIRDRSEEGEGGEGRRRRTEERSCDDGDAYYGREEERPIVGRFWHDVPTTTLQGLTTRYCGVLLRLVQYLGREESWRVASSTFAAHPSMHPPPSSSVPSSVSTSTRRHRRGGRRCNDDSMGNPLARELAIDLSYTLLELDRTDMRVRLLLPSLLLEGGYLLEAYLYLRRWLDVGSSLMIMDLALTMGHGDDDDDDDNNDDDARGAEGTGGGMAGTAIGGTETRTATNAAETTIRDALESPRAWMDAEMVYPSVGMVFELAYLKCHLLCSLRRRSMSRSGRGEGKKVDAHAEEREGKIDDDDEEDDDGDDGDDDDDDLHPILVDDDESELEYQVALLLSVVHRWNPHLLPHLAMPSSSSSSSSSRDVDAEEGIRHCIDDDTAAVVPSPPPSDDIDVTTSADVDDDDGDGDGGSRTTTAFAADVVAGDAAVRPPALSTLLNARRPGFELQYRMGNPGGGTFDEAVSIWQRDMILWHAVDPMTMTYLAEFCSRLDENLVDTRVLDGGRTMMAGGGSSYAAAASCDNNEAGDSSNANAVRGGHDSEANAAKRKEAEELVAKLRRERPDRTMDQIMMHPDMAQLMIKHLRMN